MLIFKTIKPLQKFLNSQQQDGKTIGFVPTMGALHRGHTTLMQQAGQTTDLVVVSIFVNPTQFNDKADLDKYPITIEADIEKLIDAGVDVLFLPAVEEIYPDDTSRKLDIDLGELDRVLEAAARPGHFAGVATVVKRLLDIVQPHYLFMGQKDFQQHRVVEKLIDTFNLPVTLVRCDIVREADGLAMSSRNVHLKGEHREAATLLSQTLFAMQKRAHAEPLPQLQQWATNHLNQHPLINVAYLNIINGHTLQPLASLSEAEEVAVVAAVKIGGVHLLDNVIIS